MIKNEKGQLLPAVIAIMLVLAVLIPAMIHYVQTESKWSVKAQQSSNAFQLAEAAIDRGYQKVTESTGTWDLIQAGTQINSYHFDHSYDDLSGGTYAIYIASGPEDQQVTLTGVGRDRRSNEVRTLQVVYANAPLGSNAIRSQAGVSLTGNNVQVEWGSVTAQTTIDANSRNHPQFYSAAGITTKDTSSDPPNTDSIQWWSYFQNMPPAPFIDFTFYKDSATATSTYYTGNVTWPGTPCGSDATSCATGRTYYIDGNLTINSPGTYILGTLIVTGNLTLPNGRSGQGGPTVPMPRKAWINYGNDWAYYRDGSQDACSVDWTDPTAPATFPGVNSSYLSPVNTMVSFSDDKVFVNGFLYVGGNLSQAGGAGHTKIIGSAYVGGSVSLGSNNVCVFRTEAASNAVKTTRLILTRVSWKEILYQWPTGL